MANEPKHISGCICTYERPRFLKRLLEELGDQDTSGLFTYSIDDVTATRPSGQGKTAFNNQHGWLDSRGALHISDVAIEKRRRRTERSRAMLARYSKYLKEGGVFIVRM